MVLAVTGAAVSMLIAIDGPLESAGMATLTGTALPAFAATAVTGAAIAVWLSTPAARTTFASLAFSTPRRLLPPFAANFRSRCSRLIACRLHAAHEHTPLQPGHTQPLSGPLTVGGVSL